MAEPQPFRVELSRQATRAFEALPVADRARVAKALDALEREPRPRGQQVKAIQGTRDAFLRYRVGDYRLLYEIREAERVVLVAGIVARKDLRAGSGAIAGEARDGRAHSDTETVCEHGGLTHQERISGGALRREHGQDPRRPYLLEAGLRDRAQAVIVA